MKILREGNPDRLRKVKIEEGKIIILTCKRCDCQFEVDRYSKDVEEDQKEGTAWTKCPYCKAIINLR